MHADSCDWELLIQSHLFFNATELLRELSVVVVVVEMNII